MLVLTRKLGQSIHIGEGIVLEIVRVGPQTVRIGITAPSDVRIVRGELLGTPPTTTATAIPGRAGNPETSVGGADEAGADPWTAATAPAQSLRLKPQQLSGQRRWVGTEPPPGCPSF